MKSELMVVDGETAQILDYLECRKFFDSSRGLGRAASWEKSGSNILVKYPGYLTKKYSSSLPSVIRLLRDVPYCYTEKPSAESGDRVQVFFSSSKPCKLSLKRNYGGREEVDIVDGLHGVGSVCDSDPVLEGVKDWPSTEFVLPDLDSGLWICQISDENGKTAEAPLIVKSKNNEELVVVLSFLTWNFYNHWGGRSRYKNFLDTGQPQQRASVGRGRQIISFIIRKFLSEPRREKIKKMLGKKAAEWAYWPISWKRPWVKDFDLNAAPESKILNHLAALEIKVLEWLEREGVNYRCIADVDLENGLADVSSAKGVALLGHSEYWSEKMFKTLERINGLGAWVLNISGNSIYREVCVGQYAASLNNMTFCLSGQNEANLLGVRFNEASYGTAAPYQVKNDRHWIFSGLELENGDWFGTECLIGAPPQTANLQLYSPARPSTLDGRLLGSGASGFEVDTLVDKKNFSLVAKGVQKKGASMVIREASKGRGGVFSASSINFGGSLLVDPACSKILKNVIDKSLGGELHG